MFKSLSIARFRGIREGTVPDLRQVSIFVGPNNSGKSTILDALLLANGIYRQNDPLGRYALGVLAERHNLPSYDSRAPWPALWYAYDQSTEIRLDFMLSEERTMRFNLGRETRATLSFQGRQRNDRVLRFPGPDEDMRKTLEQWHIMAAEGFGEAQQGQAYVKTEGPRDMGSASSAPVHPAVWTAYQEVRSYLRDAVLIDSAFSRNTKVEQRLWPQLIADRRDKLLTHMLREVYGMDVENLTYTPSMNGNELVILLPKYSVRVDDLGDGARYFVRMLMVLSLLKGTTLLLEEPETAHHCRAQADITRWIVRSAKERNLQVLATTHSLETVDHFLAACTESSVEFGLHHTELKDGVLSCRGVDRNDARVLMDMGVDPRCAP
jgi:hypothetical protein